MCAACRTFDGTLRRSASRLNSSSSGSSRTPFVHLERKELIARLREEVTINRALRKQNDRLQVARENMKETANSEEYALLFKQLKNGVDKLTSKVDNPVCNWKDCGETFASIEELIAHTESSHIHSLPTSTQLQPKYKCLWNGCSHKEFSNRTLFRTHLTRHTGKPEDIYFTLLLKDQARALSVPPEQMR